MGTTLQARLQNLRSGWMFHEDFESDQFVPNDGWNLIQGAANQSKDVAVNLTYSIKMAGSQDANLNPLVMYVPITDAVAVNEDFHCWFYDDATNTTLPGPFVKLRTTAGNFVTLGVRNGTSTTKYVMSSALTEDAFAATSVNRSTGWHHFEIRREMLVAPYVNSYLMFVDGTVVGYLAPGGVPTFFDRIYIQADVAGTTNDSFGYFDEVRLYRDYDLILFGCEGRRVRAKDVTETILWGLDNNLEATQPGQPLPVQTDPGYTISLEISKQITSDSDLSNYVFLVSRMDQIQMNPGDMWRYAESDFGRKVTNYQETPVTLGPRNSSLNGITETITFGQRNKVAYTVKMLEGDSWLREAHNWFDWVRKGNPFTLAVDSDSIAFASMSGPFYAGSFTFTVLPSLANTNTNITAGNQYVIQTRDGINRQVVTVTLVSGNNITVLQPLNFNVTLGDFIRSAYYWPMLENDDPNAEGLTISDKLIRRDWNVLAREYIRES